MRERQVLFVSKSIDDAATRYRVGILYPHLQDSGWRIRHVDCSRPWYRLRILLQAPLVDVLFIQRKLLGRPFFSLLRILSRKIVFDFDDAIFLKSNGKPSTTRGSRFAATGSACDLMLAGNQYLAAEAARSCRHVEVVPTCIRLADYPLDGQAEKAGPELVWIGSSSTRKYLEQHREVFEAMHAAFPQLRLKIIADFAWPDCPMPCEAVAWSREGEVRELRSARIGIAPMPDNAWTRGKCALKVLQYMAAGLPVVSSRAGANAEVIEEGLTGFLAETPQEWVDAISKLIGNAELCQRMGNSGRARVEQHYAQEAIAPKVVDMLRALCEQP